MHASMQDWSVEDANSADIALGRFGREPAAAGSGSAQDADVLSAATAVQRWELDHSHERGARQGRRKEAAGEAAGETPLMRPTLPAGGLRRPRIMQCRKWLSMSSLACVESLAGQQCCKSQVAGLGPIRISTLLARAASRSHSTLEAGPGPDASCLCRSGRCGRLSAVPLGGELVPDASPDWRPNEF